MVVYNWINALSFVASLVFDVCLLFRYFRFRIYCLFDILFVYYLFFFQTKMVSVWKIGTPVIILWTLTLKATTICMESSIRDTNNFLQVLYQGKIFRYLTKNNRCEIYRLSHYRACNSRHVPIEPNLFSFPIISNLL